MDSELPTRIDKRGADLPRLTERYLVLQLAGDLRGALCLLDEALDQGMSVTDLQCQVIQEAQRELGRLWENASICLAKEHRASAISQMALARLFSRVQPAPPRGHGVTVACVEGELHELPARLMSDFLEQAGFTVMYLGANLPTHSLLSLLEAEPMDVLALSTTMSFNLPALRRTVEEVRGRMGSGLPILVGGLAVRDAPEVVTELGVLSAGPTPAELVAAVEDALKQRPH